MRNALVLTVVNTVLACKFPPRVVRRLWQAAFSVRTTTIDGSDVDDAKGRGRGSFHDNRCSTPAGAKPYESVCVRAGHQLRENFLYHHHHRRRRLYTVHSGAPRGPQSFPKHARGQRPEELPRS